MTINAIITLVRAYPVETIKIFLYCRNEVLAGNNSVRHLSKFDSWVRVYINAGFLCLVIRQVVTIFAFFTLRAHSLFEHGTENIFGVDSISFGILFHDSLHFHEAEKRRHQILPLFFLLFSGFVLVRVFNLFSLSSLYVSTAHDLLSNAFNLVLNDLRFVLILETKGLIF